MEIAEARTGSLENLIPQIQMHTDLAVENYMYI